MCEGYFRLLCPKCESNRLSHNIEEGCIYCLDCGAVYGNEEDLKID